MAKLISTNELQYFFQKLKALFAGKVDKVEGKALSSNDFTAALKTKLEGLSNYTHPTSSGNKHIPAGGASGKILRWSADGTAAWGDDVDTTYTAMTGATTTADGASGLTPAPAKGAANRYLRSDGTWVAPPDTTYSAATASKAGLMSPADKVKLDAVPPPATIATQTYVAQQVAAAGHIKKAIVASLPAVGSADANTIYMIAKGDPKSGNGYNEYMLVEGAFELIGDTATVIETATNADIDNIMAS